MIVYKDLSSFIKICHPDRLSCKAWIVTEAVLTQFKAIMSPREPTASASALGFFLCF